jgi:RNA polymerase sigma-70 factor (ECF subfamily)
MESFADNTHALDRFLASVERRAFTMAQFATRSTEDALDIVQEAMLTLAGKYAGRPEEEWKALFHTILQNRIRDWYRRKTVRARWRVWLGRWGSREEEEEDPLADVADPDAPSPAEELIRKDEMAAVEQALKALPLRQQQAFLLRAWEGLDVEQTAAAMKCSEGSVKTHYSRAVHTLRELLKEL